MKTRTSVLTALAFAAALVLASTAAGAHTETDLVAVPAGSEATIALQPTHGCGSSPTVEVAIQAPVAGATGEDVLGWDVDVVEEDGRTVITWSGGSLPADQAGAFPVTFTATDTPGDLMVFPAIQVCEDGQELAWINGDPSSDYPAPRILVLPPDGTPAHSIEEVPADAPGREQLVEIIDVDGIGAEDPASDEGAADETEAEEPVDEPVETVSPEETTQTTLPPEDEGQGAPSDDGLPVALIAVVALVGIGLGIAASLFSKRRTDTEDEPGRIEEQ